MCKRESEVERTWKEPTGLHAFLLLCVAFTVDIILDHAFVDGIVGACETVAGSGRLPTFGSDVHQVATVSYVRRLISFGGWRGQRDAAFA